MIKILLQDILKTLRLKAGFTQVQLSKKLFISSQAISKWENGLAVPSIDNLLALSDLYNISLDELVQGSPFFKKPYLVGKKYNRNKGLGFCLSWFLISLFLTGFGYQPWWLFLLVFFVGILFVLPTMFNDYWLIENEGVAIKNYAKKESLKLKQLLTNNHELIKINYSEMQSVAIIYQTKVRDSPFDLSADLFYLLLSTEDAQYQLNLDARTNQFLPQFVTFLERNRINVIDNQHIVQLLISGQSLFNHFNQLR